MGRYNEIEKWGEEVRFVIEFNGYIDGTARKRFWHNNRVMGVKIILVAEALIIPGIMVFGIKAQNWLMVILFAVTFFILPLSALIPQGKKAEKSVLPKRIVADEESITCTTDREVVAKWLEDVKTVIDHGEFYELVFPFGKISTNFICQKNLLTKGTLEEFEALFEGKITKV